MWTARQLAGRPGLSRWAPWVVVDARATFPFCSLTEQRDRVAYLETRGYQQIFSGDGYVVPHASGFSADRHHPLAGSLIRSGGPRQPP